MIDLGIIVGLALIIFGVVDLCMLHSWQLDFKENSYSIIAFIQLCIIKIILGISIFIASYKILTFTVIL